MPQTFSLENSLGAGRRFKSDLQSAEQNQEFNALRIDNERQRGEIQQQTFDAGQQKANTAKLLQGIRIARENPNILPKVLDELVSSKILNPESIPEIIQAAQTNPEAFNQLIEDFEDQLVFSLGEAEQFGPQTTGVDPTTGDPAFGQASQSTGEFRINEGLTPSGAAQGTSAQGRFFESLIQNLPPEEQEEARRIQLGLDARAVGSANITIAEDDELTEDVAESQATIAQRKKFGEATGASRSKLIDKGFETVQSIDVNVRNIDKAIQALDEGASTGVIESRFFPSFRESTLKLEQVQKELGLDVVGGVTFGALSKGELDLALAVALNTGLQPDALKQFLVDKKAAQGKLRAYFAEQIDFLDQGGSVAGFVRVKERQGQESEETGAEAPDGTVAVDSQGRTIVKQNGQWVAQ